MSWPICNFIMHDWIKYIGNYEKKVIFLEELMIVDSISEREKYASVFLLCTLNKTAIARWAE